MLIIIILIYTENVLKNHQNRKRPLILIVDDNPVNLQVLGNKLKEQDADIAAAKSGMKALKIAEAKIPSLILLDIMMPEMDGFEVCRHLKANEKTARIPVIFLTAKVAQEDTIKGFELGAVDYITKPFNPAELLSRVSTHLKLQQYTEELAVKNHLLEKLMAEKNEFLGIAAHDLKNPIYSISMLAKVIHDEKDLSREELDEFSKDIINTSDKMLALIKNLLDINAMEQGKINFNFEENELKNIMNEIYDIYYEIAAKKNIELLFHDNTDNAKAFTDINAVRQILDNLVSNAVKYTPKGKKVYLKTYSDESAVFFEIKDEGPGFTQDDLRKLWGKFTRLSAQPTADEHSTGLGMSIVKKYADAIGAGINIETTPGEGSVFTITIPKKHE